MSAYHQWISGYGTMQSSTAAASGWGYDSAPPAKRARTAATSPPAASPVNYNAKLVIMPPNSTVNVNLYMHPHAFPGTAAAAVPRSTQLYNEVAFQQQQSPFYRVIKQLSVLSFGPKGRTTNDRSQHIRHVFNLDVGTLHEIQSGNERKLGVHIRFFSTIKQSDIALGYDSNLRVNGKAVDLTKNYKKIRSKHIQNPFITPSPAEVTSLVGQSNMMEFSNLKGLSGVAVIQLIQEISAEEIVPSIARSSPEYKKPASMGDVEETKVLVSLRCPLGYCRIEYPARGQRCNHLQCFDVRFFLQFCHQQRLWHCPVCNGPIPFHELLIDEYFNSILNSMDSETMKAEIHPDGTFTKPDKSEKKQRLAGSKRKEVGVQEIDLDAEANKQQQQQQQQQREWEAQGASSSSTDAVGPELILRPVRMERNSDDEEDEDDNADHDRTRDDEDEDDYSEDDYRESASSRPSATAGQHQGQVFVIEEEDDDHQPRHSSSTSLSSSSGGTGTGTGGSAYGGGTGGSQADTIVID